jgi:hypothetical protein
MRQRHPLIGSPGTFKTAPDGELQIGKRGVLARAAAQQQTGQRKRGNGGKRLGLR